MSKSSAFIGYILIVTLFAVVFKYGIQLSFGIDTGYAGPIFLWHSIIIFSALFKRPGNS